MSVIIKGVNAFDMSIVSNIKNVESQYIKFQNIYFKCKSIEDAGGTIFVKRKRGKWLLVEESIKVAAYKCSECGRTVWNDMGYDVVKDYPFCHCGADMRGEQK